MTTMKTETKKNGKAKMEEGCEDRIREMKVYEAKGKREINTKGKQRGGCIAHERVI